MPKHLFNLLLGALLFTSFTSSAQFNEEKFFYGFSAGASMSNLSDVSTTLIRPIFPIESYETARKDRLGFTGGVFIYYKFKDSKFAIQPEIKYQSGGGIFHYQDVNDLQYDISFDYAYLQVAPIIKYYFVGGLNLHMGPQLGFVVDRSSLSYISNQPELGPDLQIQQSLSQVLKGNNNVSMMMGLGYDLPFGLGVDLRYSLGVSDAMETLANGFYFIENKNIMRSISATLIYAIPFYKGRRRI